MKSSWGWSILLEPLGLWEKKHGPLRSQWLCANSWPVLGRFQAGCFRKSGLALAKAALKKRPHVGGCLLGWKNRTPANIYIYIYIYIYISIYLFCLVGGKPPRKKKKKQKDVLRVPSKWTHPVGCPTQGPCEAHSHLRVQIYKPQRYERRPRESCCDPCSWAGTNLGCPQLPCQKFNLWAKWKLPIKPRKSKKLRTVGSRQV